MGIMYNASYGLANAKGGRVRCLRTRLDSICAHPKLCASKSAGSTLWDKGGVDGRTREAKAKTGRGKKAGTTKKS